MSIDQQETKLLKKSLCFLLSGKAGVGKSFGSELLCKESRRQGYVTLSAHFATWVKQTAYAIGWDGVKDDAGRKLLQDIGKVGRDYDQNTWAKLTMNNIMDKPNFPYDVVVIDDWRFPNELSYIVDNEPLYKTIKIRIESKDREILSGSDLYNDVSETSLDGSAFDYVIYNSIHDSNVLEVRLMEILKIEIEKNIF